MSAPVTPRPRSRGHLGRAAIAVSARRVSVGDRQGGVNLDLVRGQITVICGAAGSGKSALLRILAGVDSPPRGTVWIGERRIDAAAGPPAWRFRRDELAFLHVSTGAGHGRLALIERALAPEPDLVFIDEPAAGLQPAELDRVHAALSALTVIERRTAVVATGSPEVATWADRILGLDHGALVLDLEEPTPVEARATAAALAAR